LISGSGFFGGGAGTFLGGGYGGCNLGLMGITEAISSSSRLSAEGSLSDPELSPSSLPVVNYISFLFFVNSTSKSFALKLAKFKSSSFVGSF